MGYNDVFKEQLVERKKTLKDSIQKAGIIIAALMMIIALGIIPVIAKYGLTVPLAVVLIWLTILALRRFNIEFEYVLTNTDLDIDKIMSKNKRKHMLTLDIRSIIVMMKVNNPEFKQEAGSITKVYDFSTGVVTDSTYGVIYERDGQRNKLLFDPNETMFNAMKMYIPKKIK